MTPLTSDLLVLFRRDLRCMAREVSLFPDDITLWCVLPGFSNSAGNLALHVAGNLRHFIGAVLGGTGYVRQREREFAPGVAPREVVLAELEATLVDLERVLPSLTDAALEAPFPIPIARVQPPTGRFLLHLAAHLAFHLGQAGTLRRALTGDATSAGGMDIPELMN